jgi:hypothetical protein
VDGDAPIFERDPYDRRAGINLRPWRGELLADFDEPVTNGYAEGVTNKGSR